MEKQKVQVHMTGGLGETSYAMNSLLQKTVILRMKPLIENMVKDMYSATPNPNCLTIADLGCSSGPNSLLVISEIIDAVDSECRKDAHKSPEFQVFLNDLPENDFNTIFTTIPHFIKRLRRDKGDEFGPCFISGMPGSFYGRLFPTQTLHFVHSSYSLHFLSQVPSGIENNKRNIHIATTSPMSVIRAYVNQFQKDFRLFISSRSKEMVTGGRMVITLIGRENSDHCSSGCCHLWEILAHTLADMVSKGLVEGAKLESLNLPYYYPTCREMNYIIQEEGSFNIDLVETFDVDWDPHQNVDHRSSALISGQNVAKYLRAIIQPIIVNHFGEQIIEELFHEFAKHIAEYLVKEKPTFFNIVLSMTKREPQYCVVASVLNKNDIH